MQHPVEAAKNQVSVVSVTFDNNNGLRSTLSSLAALRHRPLEVIVVDGASSEITRGMLVEFSKRLSLVIISESDDGIYQAMNKGLRIATGNFVHYLNAGDTVYGEPYTNIQSPSLLPVHILDETGVLVFNDFIKFGGYGYCHQGIIFPVQHPDYNTNYKIAADLDLIISMFPDGLTGLTTVSAGGVDFAMGGVSTRAVNTRNREVKMVIKQRFPKWKASYFLAILSIKNAVPRNWRRKIIKFISKRPSCP